MALDGFLVWRSPMSLRLQQPVPPAPDDTARIARAAFPRGNPYLLLRDRLGPVFDDAGFADLYPRRGQPGYTPWRLSLVTLLQFREGLIDRQAAEAVRARIVGAFLLSWELADAGFDHSVLCTFRARLLAGDAAEDAHRADPRSPVHQGAGPVRAPGRRRLRQRRAPRRGSRASWHRPDRPGPPGSELAEAGRGCLSGLRLCGGVGAPSRALS